MFPILYSCPYLKLIGELQGRTLERQREISFGAMPVTLYDPFGRPVYVPSTAPKIGCAINWKRPARFGA